jgi:hypothetical protein
MSNAILRIGIAIAVMAIVSGCGGGGEPTQEPSTPSPTEAATEAAQETEAVVEPTVADGATEVLDEPDGENPTPEAVPGGTTGTVNFPNANARTGPGTEYESLGPLQVGATLAVIARTDETDVWYLVTLENGEPGWLWGRVVDLNPPDAEVEIAATIPPTPES